MGKDFAGMLSFMVIVNTKEKVVNLIMIRYFFLFLLVLD